MKLKIGLLGVENPSDLNSYSGTPYHLAHFLRLAGHEVRICGPFPLRFRKIVGAFDRIVRTFLGKHIVWERFPLIAQQYSRIVDDYAAKNPDLDILLATSVFYAHKQNATIPLIAWGDTTVAGVMGQYPYYSNITARMALQSNRVEEIGLKSCDMAIFSSEWARIIAAENYDVREEKLAVLTYGANILRHPDRVEIESLIANRSTKTFTVLLVGVLWERKGVDKAIEIVDAIRAKGVDARLQVIGCHPPPGKSIPPWVEILGRIDKGTPDGQVRFFDLLGAAHVFLLPSVAECAAVSLVEANAYGLPFVASNVGGNSSLVGANINGYLCELSAPIETWVEAVMKFIGDPVAYRQQCLSAHSYYETRLQWSVAVERFESLIFEFLADRARAGGDGRV